MLQITKDRQLQNVEALWRNLLLSKQCRNKAELLIASSLDFRDADPIWACLSHGHSEEVSIDLCIAV